MSVSNQIDQHSEIWEILKTVEDPEIPVISIVDLGIVRSVEKVGSNLNVYLTPTYSGCPAMDVIPMLVKVALAKEGFTDANVQNILSPAWTTDWITEEGKEKLRAYGIAPPVEKTSDPSFINVTEKVVPCPQCNSKNTQLVSQFGSTPCKAAYQCVDCLEPFDYFKCH